MKRVIIFLLVLLTFSSLKAQNVPGDQLGAWYMYFFNKKFGDGPFGIQGDYQFRFWNAGSDLEQLLLLTGITYTPEKSNVLLTLGYGHITTGEFGDGTNTFNMLLTIPIPNINYHSKTSYQ